MGQQQQSQDSIFKSDYDKIERYSKNSYSINIMDYPRISTESDDTQRIQRALNDGDNICITENYYISDVLNVTKPYQRIYGNGTITQASQQKCIFVVSANNVTIDGLNFIGTGTGSEATFASGYGTPNSYGSAVVAFLVSRLEVKNCNILNCSGVAGSYGAGIYLTGASYCKIHDNYIEGCYTGINTDAYFVANLCSIENKIYENYIYNCKNGYSLDLQGGVPETATSIGDEISKNTFDSCINYGISIDTALNGFKIKDNRVKYTTTSGIQILHQSSNGIISGNNVSNTVTGCGLVLNSSDGGQLNNISVINNEFKDNYQDGIQMWNIVGLTIYGNIISGNKRGGINSGTAGNYPRTIKISNNNITRNVTHGVSLKDCLDVEVASNTIRNNSYGVQMETASVIGTITSSGNATVILTASGMSGSPKTYNVPVSLNDISSIISKKIISSLNADTACTTLFSVGGYSSSITLTTKIPQSNDTTLNLSIANGTCIGITSATNSVNTLSGTGTATYSGINIDKYNITPTNINVHNNFLYNHDNGYTETQGYGITIPNTASATFTNAIISNNDIGTQATGTINDPGSNATKTNNT